MQILAHRGYHVGEPENTLGAFEAAVKLGVDGIETDVRLSRDGHLVLLHERVLSDSCVVSEASHRELEKSVGYSIPTLQEALNTWGNFYWNIEIKTPESLEPTLSVLKTYTQTRKFFITSFRHDLMVEGSRLFDADFGLIISHRPMDLSLENLEEYPRVKTLVVKYEILDESLIRQARKAGFRCFVYGIKTSWEHKHCREMEMDGIITDFPELAGVSSSSRKG